MKYFNAVLFVFTVTNVYTATGICVSCKEVTDLFDIINGKLDTIIKNGAGGGGGPPPTPVCKPLNFQNLGAVNAKLVITGISGAFGAIADGNDVYITGYYSNKVYRYNQVTNPGKAAVAVIPSPSNQPLFFDIKDDFIYMTALSNSVYRKNLRKDGSKFEKIITMTQPVGISWSPDGERLLVSEWSSGTIIVYNANFKKITTFHAGVTYVRDISFDSNGNIRIATYTNKILIFDKNTYKLIATKTIAGAGNTEGYTVHCDGTIIVADRSGKLFFLNKDYGIVRKITGFSGLGDVAITTDGTLYVTVFGASKIFLYDLF